MLTPQQIALVLPGGPYPESDMYKVAEEAAASAQDASLMELAWQISDRDASFTAPEVNFRAPPAFCI